MKYSSLKAYELDVIEQATRFDVALFLGAGRFARATELPTIAEALRCLRCVGPPVRPNQNGKIGNRKTRKSRGPRARASTRCAGST